MYPYSVEELAWAVERAIKEEVRETRSTSSTTLRQPLPCTSYRGDCVIRHGPDLAIITATGACGQAAGASGDAHGP